MTGIPVALAGLLAALVSGVAYSQQDLQCDAADAGELLDRSLFDDIDAGDSNGMLFEAGEMQAKLGDRPSASMTGGVLVKQGERLAGADTASYDPDTLALHLSGDVRYEDPGTQIRSDSAEFSYTSGLVRFEGAEFKLSDGGARGAASALEINQEGMLKLDDVEYTTCPPGSNDWLLEAGDIDLDTAKGSGSAKNVKLRFQGVPIMYAPFLSFPIGDARKSGILTPEFGSAGRSGRAVSVPYYWNIAPNYDVTFTPRYLTDRGLQVQSEFRYLTRAHDGVLRFDYLPDDSLIDSDRHLLSFNHRTQISSGWRGLVDYRDASDSRYFEDLGGSLSVSSITHLNRSVVFEFYGDHLSIFGRFQEYQTIDETILPVDEPYQRLPQIRVTGMWPDGALGLHYKFDGEFVYFDRDIGVTGWRFDVAPEIELPIGNPGWFITPNVILEHTRYELENVPAGQPIDPSRTLPIASLDVGMILERTMRSSRGRIQTIEPRVLYVHIPHREQSGLPVFDTIVPDLNLVQLYRKNRYLGVDRIADTDQLSVGITSRILSVSNGKEIVTATIGQALYLSTQGVTLPGQPVTFSDSSDYIAELRFPFYEKFNFDLGYQWGTGNNGTTQSEARIQFRPQRNKILNLSYRFRKQSLEQGDVSWSWPLARSWNFVGRYNFSFRDDEPLERFFGLEYENCCWGLRLVTRRYISTRDGTQDSSFGLQLVLKGMTSVGTKADRLLERGILGYSRDVY
ncbi:MAG: LPS-assembly protein LptD [Woeseia sp.]